MKHKDLETLIALGEGFTTEFKRSGTANLGRELCAFANAAGGFVLIGVADDGNCVGVQDHNRLKSEVQAIARAAEPSILVDVKSVGNVLCIRVPTQQGKPYSFGGKFYLREGASSQQMSRDEIRDFFCREGLIHFDEMPCDRFHLEEDLSEEVWALFRNRANISQDMAALTALRNLHLLKGNSMTNAGAWLLARDIRKFTVSGDVACALFLGTDKVHILDRQSLSGDIYSMIDGTVAYILSKINLKLIIKHVKREERPELPEEALREAVVNALAHRDYRSTANVQIYIFKDRVEIVSPGGLPAGMTEEALGTKSVPRNPLLFGVLHRMSAVEHIGSGIMRIRRVCEEYGVETPELQVSPHWFTVIFRRPSSKPTAEGNGGTPPVGTEKANVRHQDGTKLALSKHQVDILTLCENAQPLTAIMAIMKRKDRSKFRNSILAPLLEHGLLTMTIPDKPRSSRQQYSTTGKGRKTIQDFADREEE